MNNQPNIALLVDHPNMRDASYNDFLDITRKYGFLSIAEIFFTKGAPEKVVEMMMNKGFKPRMESMGDIDHALCVRATEIICSPRYNIDIIALAAMDGGYTPIIYLARDYGKKSLGIGIDGGSRSNLIADCLRNAVDYFELVTSRERKAA